MPKLIILSGAGLSAESGIETFRSDTGLWNNHDLNIVCNYYTWKQNFEAVHHFYNQRREELKHKKPNSMHFQIAEWKKTFKNNCIVFTQNIDDLLEKAGCDDVIHLHGFSNKLKCTDCNYVYQDLKYQPYNFKTCINCGSKWVKPDVVFFGEPAPKYQTLYATFAHINQNDIVVVIGTSGKVININYLLFDTKSLNILNNLKKEVDVNESIFSYVFYEKATSAVNKIDKLVKRHLVINKTDNL